jgi:GTPase SAR1 family protein
MEVTLRNIGAVTSTHNDRQTQGKVDISKFLFKDSEMPRTSGLVNDKGRLDTSKRYFHINARNVYNVRKQIYKTVVPKIRYNDKGRQQGLKKVDPSRVTERPYVNKKQTLNPEAKSFVPQFMPGIEPPVYIPTKIEPTYNYTFEPMFDTVREIDYEFDDDDEAAKEIGKTTQGLIEYAIANATYLIGGATALGTSIASACGYYYMYHISSDVLASTKGFGQVSISLINTLKEHVVTVISVLASIGKYYRGEIDFSMMSLLIAGAITMDAAISTMLPCIQDYLGLLAHTSTQSTRRGTQAFDPTTLAEAVIGIIGALILGFSVDGQSIKAALSSIKTLGSSLLTVKTIETVLVGIIESLPDILHSLLCSTFPTLAMYSKVSTDKEFAKFLKDCKYMLALPKIDILYNSHNLQTFLDIYSYMNEKIVTEEGRRTGLCTLMNDEIEAFDDIYNSIREANLLPGKRELPFVIWISGDAGVGKSTYVNSLCKVLLEDMLLDEPTDLDYQKYIYSHNTSNRFFDGYNNQPIFILNDYLQYATDEEEKLLIKFVDTLDCNLEVASVDNTRGGIKGEVRFTSKVIIVTSNQSHLSNSTCITDLTAFNRRRDIVINMEWKNLDHSVNLQNFDYSWARMTIKHPITAIRVMTSIELKTIDDVTEEIIMRLATKKSNKEFLTLSSVKSAVSLKCKLQVLEMTEKTHSEFMTRAYGMIKSILDHKIFGIPLKFVFGTILAGTSMYLLFKNTVKDLAERLSHSASGDVTTQKLGTKTRTLMRQTMGYGKNIEEIITVINKNQVRVSTVVKTPNGEMAVQIMSGLGVGGSLIVVPKHLFYRGEMRAVKGDLITVNYKGMDYKVPYDDTRVYLSKDSDLACVNMLGSFPQLKSLANLIIDGSTKIDENGEFAFVVQSGDGIEKPFVSGIPVTAYMVDHAPYVDPYGKEFQGDQIWQYNSKFLNGDCGSVLVLMDKNIQKRIAGIHVAGDKFSGNSEVLTSEIVEDMFKFFSKQTQGFSTDADYEEVLDVDVESRLDGNFLFFGKMVKPPFQHSKTDIVKSPFYEVLQPHTTEPAVLTGHDKRLDTYVSPMILSVSKYGKTILPFNADLMEQAYSIVSDMYEPIRIHKLKTFGYDDAINATFTPNLEKINLKTSPGYPWSVNRIKKTDLIDMDSTTGIMTIKQQLRDKLNTYDTYLKRNAMFPYTLTTTLKDERVSLKKVKIGKTRTFMNFPIEYTILMRKYFDDFIDKETKYALEIGTTVGVNIYSSVWNNIHTEMARFDKHIDGDYKAFDGTIRPEFFGLYARLVNSFYKDEDSKKRDMLVTGCCFAPISVLDHMYMKLQGNPSGSRITTSFNSFVNRMYVVMSVIDAGLPASKRNATYFRDNLKIYAHGDDHFIGLTNDMSQYLSAYSIYNFMDRHNIEYTSSKKEEELKAYTELDDIFYLKSHFVYDRDHKVYKAGLEKEVIQEMVSWQRDDDLKSTEMIVNTALRYAYYWGLEYFNSIRYTLVEHITKRKMERFHLLTFAELDIEYHENGELIFDF